MDLKDRIKKARKDAGYRSQEKLAAFLGTTRDAIATYERGKVVPNDVFLQLMATKLHISYAWLKEGKGDMAEPTQSLEPFLEQLSGTDAEIVRIYIALPPEHKRILKDFARRVASASGADHSPIITEEEMAIYNKVKAVMERESKGGDN